MSDFDPKQPKCSMESPCPTYNRAHLALYGECIFVNDPPPAEDVKEPLDADRPKH